MNQKLAHLVDGKYTLQDLVDIDRLRKMFERFSQATGFTTGLVSYPEQKLLIGTGWRDICTKFHRAYPASEVICRQSNLDLTALLKEQRELNVRHCESGLVDGATPIIIKGAHVANLATGQILFEKPDIEFFRKQGTGYGYDVEAYLKALEEVPVVTEEEFKKALTFLSEMAVMLAEQGLANLNSREQAQIAHESEERLAMLNEEVGSANEELTATNEEMEAQYEELVCTNDYLQAAQDNLKESEKRFRDVALSSADWVWEVDANGKYTYASERILDVIGFKPAEVIGKTPFELMPADEAKRIGKVFLGIVQRKDVIKDLENWNLAKDGSLVCLLTNGVPLLDERGELKGYRGVDKDITERKLAEKRQKEYAKELAGLNEELSSTNEELTATYEELEAQYEELSATNDDLRVTQKGLKESQERLNTVIDAIPSGVILIDIESLCITDVNPAAAAMLGAPEASIVGLDIQQIISKTSSDDYPILDQHEQEGSSERVLLKVDGTEVHILKNAVKITLDGRVHLLETFTDITGRKRIEEQLRESEGRYRKLVQNMSEGIGIVDLEENFVFVNPVAERIFGVEPGMLVGRSLNEFLDESEIQSVLDQSQQRQSGESSIYELKMLRSDGEKRHLQISASPLHGPDGSVQGTYGLITDITERRHLEDQLRQTQKMEAIGTLAGGIAHDFNNILFAILGHAELASETIPEDNPATENIREVVNAGQRATELVTQILTFARRKEKRVAPIKVSTIVKEVVKMMRATLPTTIAVNLRLETKETNILADPTEIHQVVMNLCTNAGQAMLDSGGELIIGLSGIEAEELVIRPHADLKAGPYLVLSVSDSGTGIRTEELDRIFEPFFTTKSSGAGTGLGLAVVHGIIEDLGGSIDVCSKVGQGTTFQVYLPLVEAESVQSMTEIGEIPRGSECVLVVDDEPVLANMLKGMLGRLGYTVEVFTESSLALEAYMGAPDRYDVVITDQTMPGLTGAELARRILEVQPTQPIILCTGFSQTIPREKAEEIGIAAYVDKPVSKKNMATAVRNVLDGVKFIADEE